MRGSDADRRTAARALLTYANRTHFRARHPVPEITSCLSEALRHGRGETDLQELKMELAPRVAAGEMIRAREEVATEATIERERRHGGGHRRRTGSIQTIGPP